MARKEYHRHVVKKYHYDPAVAADHCVLEFLYGAVVYGLSAAVFPVTLPIAIARGALAHRIESARQSKK